MNLLQAIKRLSYTVGNSNKCNDTDIDALNVIIEWVNKEKEESVNANRYFGKIVISYYIELLHYHRWDNFIVEKVIQEILEQPIDNWVFKFKQNMNTKAWLDSAATVGIIDDYEEMINNNGITDERKKQIMDNNKKVMRENKDLLIKSINPWTDDEIKSKINHFISELLNKYGNLP